MNRRVALLFPVNDPHQARAMAGIVEYAGTHGNWQLTFAPESAAVPVHSMRGWSGDGIIGMLVERADVAAARSLGLPFVNLAGALETTGFPRVMVDHEAVGRLAAEHMVERGFRRLGYYGLQGVWYSQLRERGFVATARLQDGECAVLQTTSSLKPSFRWDVSVDALRQWLEGQVRPVGILAVNDHRAGMVVEAALGLGLSVPHDVAVLGVGNKESSCESCRVPISSVMRSGRKVGYEAAALLDRLMAGKRPPRRDVLIPPEGIAARASTDVIAVDDPHVAAALRFVQEHVGEVFGVEALDRVVPISRRTMEQRFRQVLKATPHEVICRTRVEAAKRLLAQPEKLLFQDVARRCGFPDSRLLRRVFRRVTGMSPAAYRRTQRP